MELKRFINISDIFDESEIPTTFPFNLEIQLIKRKNKIMANMSYMFYEIQKLSSESNFDNFDSNNIINMSYMFYNCSSLKKRPDISKLNTENVTDMSYMFYNCSSLTDLPDISNWNTNNVINTSHMFQNCESLLSLPDLSKWNIGKDTENDDMFDGCKLLEINMIDNNFEYKTTLNFLDKIFYILINYCKTFFKRMKIMFYFSFFLIELFGSLYCTFVPIYYSLNLRKAKDYIKEPIEYFDLINNMNISYISELLKITNSSTIQYTFKNKKNFINHILNFTYINNNIKFESDQKDFNKYNVIQAIFCPLNIIAIYFILYGAIFKYINFIYFLVIHLLFNITILIVEIFGLKLSDKLTQSLANFFATIKYLFQITILKIYYDDIDKFYDSCVTITGNMVFTIASIIYIIYILKQILEEKVKFNSYNDYLINKNRKIMDNNLNKTN